MTLIDTAVRDYLLADANIYASVNARIYPSIVPQECVFPAITYTTVFAHAPELLDGNLDIMDSQYQVSVWAETALEAANIAAYVRARMLGIGGNGFQKSSIDDERSGYEEQTRRFRRDLDFTVFYAESSPA